MKKNQCDQGHEVLGETRLLPSEGDDNGNNILCHACFMKAVQFRLAEENNPKLWSIPKWEDLTIYAKAIVTYVNKVTIGYVVQKYDTTTGLCVEQEFIAGDEVTYETINGENIDWCEVPCELPINHPCELPTGQFDTHYYQSFDMVQPIKDK